MKVPARSIAIFVASLNLALAAAAQEPPGFTIVPSSDYSFLVTSLPSREPPAWSVNGMAAATGGPPESLLLPLDGSADSTDGLSPLKAPGHYFEDGRWGGSLRLAGNDMLAYAREGVLDLAEGSVDFWASPVDDGSAPSMAEPGWLFGYRSTGGDSMMVAVSDRGVLHAGAVVGGAWESAYSDRASVRGWKAGTWHHVLFAWSAAASTMKMFVDGLPAGDTNERRYIPPDGSGTAFLVGSPRYRIDSFRLWTRPLGVADASRESARRAPPLSRESTFPIQGLEPGDKVACTQGGLEATFTYEGPPLGDPVPHAGLLPAGSREVEISLESERPVTCRYSVGAPLPWESMTDPGEPGPSTVHRFRVKGLAADPAVTDDVYIRCDAFPDSFLHVRWRSMPSPAEGFPRISNLWYDGPLEGDRSGYISRLGLLVPANFSPGNDVLRAMHRENPHQYILATIQPFEYFEGAAPLPESWYLKDSTGQRISMWPRSHRLNLTLPEVVEFNAQTIRRALVESDYLLDGAFFDSFSPEPYMDRDCYGKPIKVDADNDGKADDPQALRKAWRAGVLGVVERFRELEPDAIMTGHLGEGARPDFGRYFHGNNIAFSTINVIEGKLGFAALKEGYDAWFEAGRLPSMAVIDTGAPNQLGYGYGVYAGWNEARAGIPPGVLEFTRTWYPSMRFGLAFALMNDGYFERHFSDVLYCEDWWYDEFGADLGKALGPAYPALQAKSARDLVRNGNMESSLFPSWELRPDESVGAEASMRAVNDGSGKAPGAKPGKVLRVDIANAGRSGTSATWTISLFQEGIKVEAGKTYELTFRARAAGARKMDVTLQRRAGDWEGLGLWRTVDVGHDWGEFRILFEASGTRSDAGLQFFLAGSREAVEIDDVSLRELPPQVWRRDFERGTAMVNGTASPQTVDMPAGFFRIKGSQAPRWQYIIDESSKDASFGGAWNTSKYDTPAWQVNGPFYHNWGPSCRESGARGARAEWNLAIPEDGTYSIKAWWTKAPPQSGWAKAATYEVVARGKVLARAVVDQSAGGDAWVEVARLRLNASDKPALRLTNGGDGILYADAILVESEARYNDGSPVREVRLGPWDGIVLMRSGTTP